MVDYDFTSEMEDRLDKISHRLDRLTLQTFYHGDEGLIESINMAVEALHWSVLYLGQRLDNREIRIRVGRYGAYVERNVDSKKR